MARLSLTTRKRKQRRQTLILAWWNQVNIIICWFIVCLYMLVIEYQIDKPCIRYTLSKISRHSILNRYVYGSDTLAISNIRMTRRCFEKLCGMLITFGGLKASRNMDIEEQVTIFLHMIAHNIKNRVMISNFHRSGETISRTFSRVCNAVIRLHSRLLKKPEPVPENSIDHRWKWFKNCLGALDGTYIQCLVPIGERPRYRTRKGDIATNVLGVCSQDMQFIFVLPGWEGSAADGRVLRDALDRPNGLRVARPGYYLVDAGYTNGEGFLAPYRGQRYHLNDWSDGHQPTTPKEFYNMRHSSARNVIERCFGLLKGRWKILKDNSFYPIDTKIRIIMACCLLHNFIRQELEDDPQEMEDVLDEGTGDGDGYGEEDNISSVGTSNEWTTFRNWDAYLQSHKGASKWKNKKLPHYEDLCIVFGKDRAQGNRAKVATEMEEQVNIEELEEDSHDSFDEAMEGSHTARTTTSVQVEEVSSVPSKKRKSTSQTTSMVESFNDAVMYFGERLKESSAELSEGIKLEVELNKKTAMLTLELEKMTSLSQLERFKAIRKMKSDHDSVLTFWDLKEEEREDWVRFVMSEN